MVIVSDEYTRPKPNQLRTIKIVSAVSTVAELIVLAQSVGNDDNLILYFYLQISDVKKHAYHAKVSHTGGGWLVERGNVAERRKIWDDYHEENT